MTTNIPQLFELPRCDVYNGYKISRQTSDFGTATRRLTWVLEGVQGAVSFSILETQNPQPNFTGAVTCGDRQYAAIVLMSHSRTPTKYAAPPPFDYSCPLLNDTPCYLAGASTLAAQDLLDALIQQGAESLVWKNMQTWYELHLEA